MSEIIEEFRLYVSMPRFSQEHIDYLKSFGIEIPQPERHIFYGEKL